MICREEHCRIVMIVLRVMLRVILLSVWYYLSPIPHDMNRSHVNFWVRETRAELLEGTVYICCYHDSMYVLNPPQRKEGIQR